MLDTIALLRHELAERVPLIGFAGAPFTMAAYAIEGGPSTTYARTKAFMYAQPAAWHELCDRFATVVAGYLRAQVDAGAQAIQVFDSWAGQLVARGLPRVRDAAHEAHLRRAGRSRRAVDPFRRRHDRDPAATLPRPAAT